MAGYVFLYANFGQNFVVHMGVLYDNYGAALTGLISAGLKVIVCLVIL